MAKTLDMTFGLSDGKEHTISLASPKSGLVRADVESVMNNMIAKRAILVGTVSPSSIKKIVTREVTITELV